MKIIFSLLIFFFIVVSLNAQDFSFNLMFEDNVGNKDSLLLGYSIDAHDDLFVSDGEINIAGTPRDSNLCLRISDSFQDGFVQPSFESKVSISLDHCEDFWFYPVTIDINSKNWPITANWDSEKFETECVIGTVFTDFLPGGWFDAGGCCSDLEYVYLTDTNEVTFTQALYPNNNGGSGYINESGDTISTFFFAFGDSGLLHLMAHPIKKGETI